MAHTLTSRVGSSSFVTLVAGSWVVTTITQSGSLEKMIRSVLESGRTVTFAIKRGSPPDPEFESEFLPDLDEGEAITPEKAFEWNMN